MLFPIDFQSNTIVFISSPRTNILPQQKKRRYEPAVQKSTLHTCVFLLLLEDRKTDIAQANTLSPWSPTVFLSYF